MDATSRDQESVTDTLRLSQCKDAIDYNLSIRENKEDLTNHDKIGLRISLIMFNYEKLYSITSASSVIPHTTTCFKKCR